MAFSPSTPITGTSQVGLTSPTYTISADTAPDSNGKQFAVTALGGTQTGVEAHSASNPFTLTMFRPKNIRLIGVVDPNTNQLRNVPMNVYTVIVRKGIVPLVGQNPVAGSVTMRIAVPAGSDLADPESVRAMLSAAFGLVSQTTVSSGIGDTCVTGVL